MNEYYYLDQDGLVIKVQAYRKPSPSTALRKGMWFVMEFNGKGWELACFPEVTWAVLKNLRYIGKVKG